jgi:hypothetical protein
MANFLKAHRTNASDREAAAASASRRPICKNDDDGLDVDAPCSSAPLPLLPLLVLARSTRLLVEDDEEIDDLFASAEP